MRYKSTLLGIFSILLSLLFFVIVRLLYFTERLGNFYPTNFPYAFPAIYLALPGLIIGLTITAVLQKGGNKFFAYLAALVSVPVILISLYWTVLTLIYISLIAFSR